MKSTTETETGFAPSQMSIELASEVISAEAANKLTEFRRACKSYIKDIDDMIRKQAVTPGAPHNLLIAVGRDYAATIGDALRVQGYGVCLGLITGMPDAFSLSIAW